MFGTPGQLFFELFRREAVNDGSRGGLIATGLVHSIPAACGASCPNATLLPTLKQKFDDEPNTTEQKDADSNPHADPRRIGGDQAVPGLADPDCRLIFRAVRHRPAIMRHPSGGDDSIWDRAANL